jgi:hypothetical protein
MTAQVRHLYSNTRLGERRERMLQRVKRRLVPLIVTVGMAAAGTMYTTLGADMVGSSKWGLPYDLWGTLLATSRLAHGHIGGLYAPGTGLISLPGAAIILLPCAWVIAALGLPLNMPGAINPHPQVWLLTGPYQIALCCIVLFAVDAIAERLGAGPRRRIGLVLISTIPLWSVSTLWGHPEDAVAVGLLLYAVLAQSNARTALAGWLAGAAVCVQPLVLLALPVLLALLPWRRMPAFLLRSALPSAVSLGVVAIANWHDTYLSITSQPNSPVVNHRTIWTSLAPHMTNTNVAAGPFRLATILLACAGAILIRRRLFGSGEFAPSNALRSNAPRSDARWSDARWSDAPRSGARWSGARWSDALLIEALWWIAVALALRSFFEPVMVSYYVWPPIAVALIPAGGLNRVRLLMAAILATGVTLASNGDSHNVWIWWVPLVIGLLLLLAVSRHYRADRQRSAAKDGGDRRSDDALAIADRDADQQDEGQQGGDGQVDGDDVPGLANPQLHDDGRRNRLQRWPLGRQPVS